MDGLQEILTELGYNLSADAKGFRSRANFRNGDNDSSLLIYRDGSGYTDFARGSRGSLYELIQLTLGLKTEEESKNWLKNKDFLVTDIKKEEPKLKMPKILDAECLSRLLPIYDYWSARKISDETLREFGGGLCMSVGKFRDYFIFPVYNSKKALIGLSGRYTGNLDKPKWKHYNSVQNWNWPLINSLKYIKETGSIVIVESIGDALSLWESGIKNIYCIFGLEIHIPQINTLLRINPKRIIISLNNDENKNDAGNIGAEKLRKNLCKYFNDNQVLIHLPQKEKDWNDVLVKQGMEEIRNQWQNFD